MLRAWLLIAVLVAPAAADPLVAIGISVGGRGKVFTDHNGLDPVGGVRVMVSWDSPPLEPPATDGSELGGDLVPELGVGAMSDGDTVDGVACAGLRLMLRLARRHGDDVGSGALYIAARAAAFDRHVDPGFEVVNGIELALASGLRIAGEFGVLARHVTDPRNGSLTRTQPTVISTLLVRF